MSCPPSLKQIRVCDTGGAGYLEGIRSGNRRHITCRYRYLPAPNPPIGRLFPFPYFTACPPPHGEGGDPLDCTYNHQSTPSDCMAQLCASLLSRGTPSCMAQLSCTYSRSSVSQASGRLGIRQARYHWHQAGSVSLASGALETKKILSAIRVT